MAWYKCLVHGENFPGEVLGEQRPVGFYTNCYVEAATPEAAEQKVLALLRLETRLQLPAGVSPSPATKIFFDEIVEVSALDVPDVPEGFSWYVEGT